MEHRAEDGGGCMNYWSRVSQATGNAGNLWEICKISWKFSGWICVFVVIMSRNSCILKCISRNSWLDSRRDWGTDQSTKLTTSTAAVHSNLSSGACHHMLLHLSRDVMEPAKIHIRRMRISCAKSVGCGCGFVARTKLVPAITATGI